jgi:integrase
MWDAGAPGLALRVTAADARAYVFQSKLAGVALRMTIGSPNAWSIPKAQAEARRLQQIIDAGRDPRLEKATTIAADQQARAAVKAERQREEVTGLDVWPVYCKQRSTQRGPKGKAWGARSLADHRAFASPGEKRKRGDGTTQAGILHALLRQPLATIDAAAIKVWAKREERSRATRAALAYRMLRGFLRWCASQADYRALVNPTAGAVKETELFGKPAVKSDVLQREQLPAWFAAVRAMPNPVAAAYLQTVLLTGARPGEVRAMKWADLNTKWKGLTVRDKVEGTREIPLTPYVAHMLAALPRRNEYVFSGVRSPTLTAANELHTRACAVAGIEGLTLHGLRRSFRTLSEWLDIPAGVVAQLMGHKPSATAEKHYTVRPLDLLRLHHERIEAWILKEAGIAFDAAERGGLRVVAVAA